MPEGDVVLRTAARLHEALAGRDLSRVDLRWGDLDGGRLRGRETIEVVARGKHILHRVEGGWTLHSHLRMEGSWRIAATDADARAGRDARAVLVTEAWTALGLRLGMLDIVRTADEHRLVGHLGPDVLGTDWDEDLAVAAISSSRTTIAEALLDQRNLAGLGTIFTSEPLFYEGLGPWTPADALPLDLARALVRRARRLIRTSAGPRFGSTTGSLRRGEEHFVHGRSGRPCRRCGTTVRVAPLGAPPHDRVLFYCPGCQGGLAPTDDGRPQHPLGSGGPRGAGRAR